MKNILLTLFCLFSIFICAQQKTLSLHKINTERTITLLENQRIRVKTIQGEVYKGKFTIIDDNTIAIKNDTIALNTIYKIRKQSFVSGTIATVIKIGGGAILAEGLAFAVQGGLASVVGVIIIPVGAAIGSIGFIVNGSDHKSPLWEYKIASDTESPENNTAK